MKNLCFFSTLITINFLFFSSFTSNSVSIYLEFPVIFDHYDRAGDHEEINRSIPNLEPYGWANKISYIKIPEGWSVTLYDHKNYCGDYISLSPGSHKLAHLGKWHNKATSLKIYKNEKLQGYNTSCPPPKKRSKVDPSDKW